VQKNGSMAKTRIIAVCNLKGGAGKSTLATNLAGQLSAHATTALIDCDNGQGTSSSWYALRQEAGKTGNLAFAATDNHNALIAQVDARRESFIVLDGPPRISEMTRAMVMVSDCVLIPVAANAIEIWATGDLLSLIDEAKKIRRIKVRGVWSRHRPGTRLGKDITDQVGDALDLQFCDSFMSQRIAYQRAIGEGKTIVETKDSIGRLEMNSLVDEIIKLLK
jgi:chromosome partitioning protein